MARKYADLEVIKCNAAHVKNVPGRKTDAADCAGSRTSEIQRLCKTLEDAGMARRSGTAGRSARGYR